jgi:hypothetical protein
MEFKSFCTKTVLSDQSYGSKADIDARQTGVRFSPEKWTCPLSAKSTYAPGQVISSCCVRVPSFTLDLNGNAMVIGSARKDHQVATRGLVLAAHQLTDWSDCINDGCPGRVGHETLQWF